MADAGPAPAPAAGSGPALTPTFPSMSMDSSTPAMAAAPSAPSSSPSPSQALIVTSAPSRAQYAQNQADFQQAIANRTPPTTMTDISSFTPAQQRAFMEAASLSNGRAKFTGAGPSTFSNPSPTPTPPVAPPAGSPNPPPAPGATGTPGAGAAPGATGGATGGAGGAGAASTTDQNGTDPYAATLSTITDPGLRAEYASSLQSLDQGISDAKSTLAQAQATVQNDPAAQAAINAISAQYDQLIQQMKDKNTQLIGRANTSVAAFGGLGPMSQQFLNDEQARADQRVQNLVNQEQSLMLKARIASQQQDFKALNDAMTQYNTANQKKLDALNQLLTETNKAVTQNQAQQRLDQTAAKNSLAADVSKSANLGVGVYQAMKAAGIDLNSNQGIQYIQGMADEYGIQNVDMLTNAVAKAAAADSKAGLTAQNIQSEINTRQENANTSAARLSLAEQKAAKGNPTQAATDLKTRLSTALSTPGTTLDDGTAVTDSNGYITPVAWKALIAQAPKMKLTRQQFIKDYGNYVYQDSSGNISSEYGLTAPEQKLLTGVLPTTP